MKQPSSTTTRSRSAPPCPAAAPEGDELARRDFERMIETPDYPCLGARAVLRQKRMTVRTYAELGTRRSAAPLLRDLRSFDDAVDVGEGFASFVALFPHDECHDDSDFERLLWAQLQAIHDMDDSAWDASVASDPDDPTFSFSAAGHAYYVIGMHPRASRRARRAAHPTLVFNPHEQFENLRHQGKYDRLRDINRRRDVAFDGEVNPMMADHGAASEARQYSGRAVPKEWQIPFTARPADGCPAAKDDG